MILNDLRSYILKIPQHKSVPALDLFAGVGVIGIEITDIVKSVTGVELSTLSKEFALKNAEQNNVSNFSFVESDVSVALELIENDQILLVDPTRAGLSKDVLSEITKKQPTYICYISCNPESQYRDFKHLKEFYTIELLRGYNIFPKTHHIESMLILKRKKND
jgi:23S rRNA (uracil1939-C5)-methyltransferase